MLKLTQWIVLGWFGTEIRFTTPDGTRFVSMANNYSSFIVCFSDYRDPNIHAFMRKNLNKDSVFVDAGANIGTYTVRAGQLISDEGKVVAIEAHPFTYGYLLKNIQMNHLHNVIPVNSALGPERGAVDMAYASSNAGETHVAVDTEESVSVRMQTLDVVLHERGIQKVDYIKIDVEGFEVPLLMGARKTIAANPRIIIQTEIEEKHSLRYGRSTKELAAFLFGLGMSPHAADFEGNTSLVKESELETFADILWWHESAGPIQ